MLWVRQKVVCIGTDGSPRIDWDAWAALYKVVRPVRGSIYTVRDTRIGSEGRQFIRLVEIVNPPAKFSDAPDQEPWWWAEAFRPLVERETDISVFQEILRKATRKRSVDA